MTIGDRIRALRKEQKLTQADLAAKVSLTYIQIGRYEQQKSKPSADVVRRLADALGTTADYLMNGDSQAVAATKVTDRELLDLFAAVEELDDQDQKMVKTFIDALVTKRRVQALA
ncbi:helix-turn-helix transcriptional regulator [Neolewinella aurantiaca]|uniref:Helix-turn-helix transcriptional regulator n=2 Tax=Neolewinella aurantiaca TaxID=2602767 RepID=A0A5C7FAD4_9BACT|nr:helix-turn-helix transcriptional regulator [Neolewinella aurantiaca]